MSSISGDLSLRQRPPLRFIHASDLHLGRTIEGISEGPVHWEQRFLDVSRRAAERLFQRVVEESVDFLILSGEVLNANDAPPGLFLFLLEQFERLTRAGIPVYWAGGEFDSPEDWPTAFPLPDNVHHFPSNSIQEYYFQRPSRGQVEFSRSNLPFDAPIAKIVGMSRNQQRRKIRSSVFPLDPGGLYTIAVADGDVEPESLSQRRIDYWALGGSSQRRIFQGNPRKKGPDGKPIPLDPPERTGAVRRDRKDLPPQPYTVHYPGATVARSPQYVGSYGATLVEVPWDEEPILSFFPTSPIRWVNDRVSLDVGDDGGKLADEIRIRIKNYRENQHGDDLMISWFVDVPPGPLAVSLRRGTFSADLLSELRSLYGKEDPITWSVSLSLLLPEQLPRPFYEQQTILGDFLRSVKHFQDNPHEIIDLGMYLPGDWDNEETAARLLLADKIENDALEAAAGSDEDGMTDSPLEPALSRDNKAVKAKPRLVQSGAQAEKQRHVLREAAWIGLELLGGDGPKPFFHDGRSVSLADTEIESEEEEQL